MKNFLGYLLGVAIVAVFLSLYWEWGIKRNAAEPLLTGPWKVYQHWAIVVAIASFLLWAILSLIGLLITQAYRQGRIDQRDRQDARLRHLSRERREAQLRS